MMMQLNSVPEIEYEAHPAFAGLTCASDPVNAQAEVLVAEIDAAYHTALEAEDPENTFDSRVMPHIAALTGLARDASPSPFTTPFLARALDLARDTMRDNLAARGHTLSNSAADALPGELREGLDAFRRDGFWETSMQGLARRVWRGTWIERATLRDRAMRDPSRLTALALHFASPAVTAIRKAVREADLEALISAYLGRPVALHYASLEYAHAGQTWFKGCYAAKGFGDSKTVYMHLDADAATIKALFYLHDVSEKDGPFSFVRGSHRWSRSPFRVAIQKGFDQASTTTFPMTPNGLDYQQGYYRPRFQNADYKTGMMALPRALRGSTHFGDDVLDGSELSDALLRDEHTFIAPADTMVLFDGSQGIHRGSLTAAGGERWALQLAFKACDEAAPAGKSGMTTLRGHLSYLKHSSINLLRLVTGKA